jgi:hypothetical protein
MNKIALMALVALEVTDAVMLDNRLLARLSDIEDHLVKTVKPKGDDHEAADDSDYEPEADDVDDSETELDVYAEMEKPDDNKLLA